MVCIRVKAAWGLVGLFGLAWLSLVMPAAGQASRPAPGPTTRPTPIMRQYPVLPESKLTLQQLARYWDASGTKDDGVSVVVMPFHTRPEARGRLEALANAFSFLISFDLDYADNCYCARHSYFIFKRGRGVQPTRSEYRSGEIAELVHDWNGTHAVGGLIDGPDAEHLAGVLEVYDARGNQVFLKGYKEPRPWNVLLVTPSGGFRPVQPRIPPGEMRDLCQDALQACSRNPGNQRLMLLTTIILRDNKEEPVDPDLMASLRVRSLASKAMPGVEDGSRAGTAVPGDHGTDDRAAAG